MAKHSVVCAFLLPLALAALAGCGAKYEKVVIEPNQPLEDIKLLVDRHVFMKHKPPARLQDLNPYEPEGPIGYRALTRGTCILVYGVGTSQAPADADKVLAYEAEASANGGYVLMQDGTVKKMTAAEFQSAPKAKL